MDGTLTHADNRAFLLRLGAGEVYPVVALVLASKVVIFCTIVLAYHWFPYAWLYYGANLHYPADAAFTLRTAFQTWDAQHYLYLSSVGYAPGGGSNSFAPLFPLLIAGVSQVARDRLVAALLISNVLSAGAAYGFYRFCHMLSGNRRIAIAALLLLLAFPTSFYLTLPYTEALFLALSVGFFYSLYRHDYRWCALCAFLLPLSRPTGILIAVPWVLYHFLSTRAPGAAIVSGAGARSRRADRRRTMRARKPRMSSRLRPLIVVGTRPAHRQSVAYLCAPLLGYLANFVFLGIATGDPFSGIKAQSRNIAAWHVSYVLRPDLLVENIFSPLFSSRFHLLGFTDSLMDRGFFLLFLVSLPLVLMETDYVLFSFYFLLGMVPMLGSFMSYSRYLMPAFPVYYAVAAAVERRGLHWLLLPAALLSYCLAIVLLANHALNYWVA